MTTNLTEIAIEPIADVPETASVCHFDEIDDSFQETIACVQQSGRSTVTVDAARATQIDECRCDVIKFTEYYSVSRL